MNRLITSLAAGLLLLAGCADHRNPAEPESSAEAVNAQAVRENEANQRVLVALIAEIDPHVRYHANGTWSVDPAARLSPSAVRFALDAQRHSAEHVAQGVRLSRNPVAAGGAPVYALATSANYQGLAFYWWGARVSLRSAVAQEIYSSWWKRGVRAAVQAFLKYFGYSGWAVNAAGALVPAYAWTIGYVDRVGGYRGVHMHVPWSIVPTYIAPQ